MKQKMEKLQSTVNQNTKKLDNTQRKVHETIGFVTTALEKQSEANDTKMKQLQQQIFENMEQMNNQTLERQNEIDKKIKMTETQMETTAIAMDNSKDKLNKYMETMKSSYKEMVSSVTNSSDMLTESLQTLKSEMDMKQQEFTEKQSEMDANFQCLRFEVDKITSQKADVEDLKWKLDIEKFEQFTEKWENQSKELNEYKQISNEMSQKHDKDCVVISQRIKECFVKNDELKDSMEREYNKMIYEIQTLRMKMNEGKSNDNVQLMIDELRVEMEELLKISNMKNKPLSKDPSGSTLAGSCFSCGQPFKPKLSFDFKKKPALGGGFKSRRTKSVIMMAGGISVFSDKEDNIDNYKRLLAASRRKTMRTRTKSFSEERTPAPPTA